jgi:hypothetical protein
MNAYNNVSLKTEEVLQIELEVLKQEHRDLDQAVIALEERSIRDQLTIQRLKKKETCIKRQNCSNRGSSNTRYNCLIN